MEADSTMDSQGNYSSYKNTDKDDYTTWYIKTTQQQQSPSAIAKFKLRLATFKNFLIKPFYPTPSEICLAGFKYTSINDKVICEAYNFTLFL